MRHPTRADKPYRPGGTNTRYAKKKAAERREAAEDKAVWRYNIVRYVYREGLEDEERPTAFAFVEQAIEDGELDGPAPHIRTFRRWMDQAEAQGGPGQISHWYDDPRCGRDAEAFDPVIRDFLDEAIKKGVYPSLAQLHRDVQEEAEKIGLEEEEIPSYYQVKRYEQSKDPMEISTYRHGRKAGLADNAPSLSIPVEHPWEVCTLDETGLPGWIKAYHPQRHEYVPIKPWVIMMVDNYSDVIVSYRVVPPFLHGLNTSYRAEDILGTVISAGLPELAPPACARYSGRLPETMYWDKHSTHSDVADRLERVGVAVPDGPGGRPQRQGQVEVLNRVAKTLCYSIHGYAEEWLPATEAKEDPRRSRTRAAATKTHRETRRKLIAVKDLLGYHEFVEEFDKQVKKYNERERKQRPSPDVTFFSKLDDEVGIPGLNALHALDHRQLTVSRQGIRHGGEAFSWHAAGRHLTVGRRVHVRPDPLLRGIYADWGEGFFYLPPANEADRKANHVETLKTLRRRAKEASEASDAARETELEEQAGPGAQAAAQAEFDAAQRRRKEQEDGASGEELESAGAPSASEPTSRSKERPRRRIRDRARRT